MGDFMRSLVNSYTLLVHTLLRSATWTTTVARHQARKNRKTSLSLQEATASGELLKRLTTQKVEPCQRCEIFAGQSARKSPATSQWTGTKIIDYEAVLDK